MSRNALEQAGIHNGATISFKRESFTPEGNDVAHLEQFRINSIAGGGFGGAVLIGNDSVIKTSELPPFRGLIREINWGNPFQPGYRLGAQLSFLGASLLHDVVPKITEGKLVTPAPLGYTKPHLSMGYAQVLERVRGRIPTLSDNGEEYDRLLEQRRGLWEVFGEEMGFEQAAQIHPENPFGFGNMWVGQDGVDIWLDDRPALPIREFYWPFLRYKHQRGIRETFGDDGLIFDRVHTDRLRKSLQHPGYKKQFSEEELAGLHKKIELYDELREDLDKRLTASKRAQFAHDGFQRKELTAVQAEQVRTERLAYADYRVRKVGRLVVSTARQLAGKVIPGRSFRDQEKGLELSRVFWGTAPRGIKNSWRLSYWLDTDYAKKRVVSKTILNGYTQAMKHGLVDRDEYDHALSFMRSRDLAFFSTITPYYFIASRFSDAVTIPLIAQKAAEGDRSGLVLATALNLLGPGSFRAASTIAIGGIMRQKLLLRMAAQSFVPMAGTYMAAPSQIHHEYGHISDKIGHYNLRALCAKISSLKASGGWGSREEKTVFEFMKNEQAALSFLSYYLKNRPLQILLGGQTK